MSKGVTCTHNPLRVSSTKLQPDVHRYIRTCICCMHSAHTCPQHLQPQYQRFFHQRLTSFFFFCGIILTLGPEFVSSLFWIAVTLSHDLCFAHMLHAFCIP